MKITLNTDKLSDFGARLFHNAKKIGTTVAAATVTGAIATAETVKRVYNSYDIGIPATEVVDKIEKQN